MPQRSAPAPNGLPLPPQLAAGLAPPLRGALNHRVRRSILRTLNQTPEPRSLTELSAAVPDATLSALGYHLGQLERAGSLTVTAAPTDTADGAWRYASNAGDRQAVVVLEATEQIDR